MNFAYVKYIQIHGISEISTYPRHLGSISSICFYLGFNLGPQGLKQKF
jgi:hypothetical protein